MDDLISRQAALSVISSHFLLEDDKDKTVYEFAYEDGIQTAFEDVRTLPPVIPEQKTGHWIPVSERLPEKAFGCLVTVEEDDIHGELHRVIYPDFVGYDGETWNDADGEVIPFDVIAWMPLPEPYKAESEDEG